MGVAPAPVLAANPASAVHKGSQRKNKKK